MTQYLIDFKNDASDEAIQGYLTTNQCTVLGSFDKLSKVFHVETQSEPPIDSIVELIQNDELSTINLLDIKPIYQFPPIENTTTVDHQNAANWWKIYSYSQIDLSDDTTNVPVFGKGTNIYIVDSGIDISHPEFTGKDITLLHSIIPNDFADYRGHGTALASVMIGNTCGISNASLKVVKIFNDAITPIKQSDVLYAFNAILNDVAVSTNIFSVVNLSWTIPKNEYIENKIQYMIDAGIVVVAAAGNSGVPIEQVTPASMPGVITVGAYQENFEPCDFSNYTDPTITSLTQNVVNTGALDVWAPGEKIYVATSSNLGGGYGFTAGTSIAAAIESASIAFNLAQAIYIENNTDMSDLSNTGKLDINYSIKYGRSGLLDLSDPKYINSKNKICSFQLIEQEEKNQLPYVNKNYDSFTGWHARLVKVGTRSKQIFKIGNPLFNKYEVKSILPNWVTIVGHWLVFTPTTEPIAGENSFDKFNLTITLYPEDMTVDPIDWEISVFLMGSTYDIDTQGPTESDPDLKLFLQAYCRTGCCIATGALSCYPIFGCYSPSFCDPRADKNGYITVCSCSY